MTDIIYLFIFEEQKKTFLFNLNIFTLLSNKLIMDSCINAGLR